eukprot:10252908-Lingulodinium_polyedra.AAC.1
MQEENLEPFKAQVQKLTQKMQAQQASKAKKAKSKVAPRSKKQGPHPLPDEELISEETAKAWTAPNQRLYKD